MASDILNSFILIACVFLFGLLLGFAIGYDNTELHMPNCQQPYYAALNNNGKPVCRLPPEAIREYYISYPDSNYAISCPVEPVILIKDINIGGWE